jgi:polyisoprenoid-binding protein YceI
MKTILLTITTLIFMTATTNAQLKMTADTQKSTLNWLGEKILGQHTGTIQLKNGWLNWDNNKILSGEFVIDKTTIKDDDSNARLERHLKSDDFFGVDKFLKQTCHYRK